MVIVSHISMKFEVQNSLWVKVNVLKLPPLNQKDEHHSQKCIAKIFNAFLKDFTFALSRAKSGLRLLKCSSIEELDTRISTK